MVYFLNPIYIIMGHKTNDDYAQIKKKNFIMEKN